MADEDLKNYLVEVSQTVTHTYSVRAVSEHEATQRYAEAGVPIHSESVRTEPQVVGIE